MLPVNQIKPTVEETWEGVRAMCMEIKSEYVSIHDHFDNEIASDNWDENDIIQVVPWCTRIPIKILIWKIAIEFITDFWIVINSFQK